MRAIIERLKSSLKPAATALLRTVRPSVTLALILKALLGVVLFFTGIVFGLWLMIRYRRRLPG